MSFNTQETSVEGSAPIELYEFRLGVLSYLFTSNPASVTYNSLTYDPLEVKRETLDFSPDNRAEIIKVTVPASHPLVRQYINSVPGQRATLVLRRVQRFDGSNELIQMLAGTVRSVGFALDGLSADIAVMPITGDLANTIPRFMFSGLCNNVLFDQGCTVASSLFRYTGLVSGVSNDTVTVNGLSAKGSGWAVGGFLALAAGDYRLIIAHTGDTIRLLLPFPSSPLGQTVDVFAGCDHTAATCQSKFGNGINHGGYPFVPLRNIFSSGIAQ